MIAIALLVTVGASSTAPPLLRFRGGGLELVRDYIELCTLYQTKPHPSVLTALRWDLSHLHPSGTPFRDHDLLPLCDLLLQKIEGTHRSLLPVSKTTENFCEGVPISTSP